MKIDKNIEITQFQIEVIIGLLLSDGYLSKISNNNTSRLEFTFKKNHYDFIVWLKLEILGSICTTSLPTPYPKENPTQYWFGSKKLKSLALLYNDWYTYENNKRKKIIPNSFINNFTEVSLAYMIMGDGFWDTNQNTIVICTECFSLEDIHKLLFILRHKFNLRVTTNKRSNIGFRLRFSSKIKNIILLRNLTSRYFHPIMLYKLGL